MRRDLEIKQYHELRNYIDANDLASIKKCIESDGVGLDLNFATSQVSVLGWCLLPPAGKLINPEIIAYLLSLKDNEGRWRVDLSMPILGFTPVEYLEATYPLADVSDNSKVTEALTAAVQARHQIVEAQKARGHQPLLTEFALLSQEQLETEKLDRENDSPVAVQRLLKSMQGFYRANQAELDFEMKVDVAALDAGQSPIQFGAMPYHNIAVEFARAYAKLTTAIEREKSKAQSTPYSLKSNEKPLYFPILRECIAAYQRAQVLSLCKAHVKYESEMIAHGLTDLRGITLAQTLPIKFNKHDLRGAVVAPSCELSKVLIDTTQLPVLSLTHIDLAFQTGNYDLLLLVLRTSEHSQALLMKVFRDDVTVLERALQMDAANAEKAKKAKVDNVSPSFAEALLRHIYTARSVVDAGNWQIVTNAQGETPMHLLAKYNREDLLFAANRLSDDVLQKGFIPSQRSDTPLHLAVQGCSDACFEQMVMLAKNKDMLNSTNNYGTEHTAFHLCVAKKLTEKARQLLAAGARINVDNSQEGCNAMRLACETVKRDPKDDKLLRALLESTQCTLGMLKIARETLPQADLQALIAAAPLSKLEAKLNAYNKPTVQVGLLALPRPHWRHHKDVCRKILADDSHTIVTITAALVAEPAVGSIKFADMVSDVTGKAINGPQKK